MVSVFEFRINGSPKYIYSKSEQHSHTRSSSSKQNDHPKIKVPDTALMHACVR